MKKILIVLALFSAASCNPFKGINGAVNKIDYELEKQNDSQRYERRKQVEDTARAMVASYESDKQTYLAMKDVNKEVSLQAKIRANSTAISYNEYILKNSFLWADNIPEDIKSKLEIIE